MKAVISATRVVGARRGATQPRPTFISVRTLDTTEMALIERRLAQAGRMLLRRIFDLLEKIADGDPDEAYVVDIEAKAGAQSQVE